jgi:hypothetical protein
MVASSPQHASSARSPLALYAMGILLLDYLQLEDLAAACETPHDGRVCV